MSEALETKSEIRVPYLIWDQTLEIFSQLDIHRYKSKSIIKYKTDTVVAFRSIKANVVAYLSVIARSITITEFLLIHLKWFMDNYFNKANNYSVYRR